MCTSVVPTLKPFRAAWATAAARSGLVWSGLSEEEHEWIQGHYVHKGTTSNRAYGVRDFGDSVNNEEFKELDLSRLRDNHSAVKRGGHYSQTTSTAK